MVLQRQGNAAGSGDERDGASRGQAGARALDAPERRQRLERLGLQDHGAIGVRVAVDHLGLLGGDTGSFPYPSLANGTTYTFTVQALNGAGTGPESEPTSPVTAAPVPGAPTAVVATAGDGEATVAFAPPASAGGAPITSYTATASPGGQTATGDGSPLVVTGLTNGVSYTFTVAATNSFGDSFPSTPSAAVVPLGPPGAPTAVVAAAGDGQAQVAFAPPASDGGSAIAYYTATASPGGRSASGTSSAITVGGLDNGTSYTFTVTATNGVATGQASAVSGAVVPAGPPRPHEEPHDRPVPARRPRRPARRRARARRHRTTEPRRPDGQAPVAT